MNGELPMLYPVYVEEIDTFDEVERLAALLSHTWQLEEDKAFCLVSTAQLEVQDRLPFSFLPEIVISSLLKALSARQSRLGEPNDSDAQKALASAHDSVSCQLRRMIDYSTELLNAVAASVNDESTQLPQVRDQVLSVIEERMPWVCELQPREIEAIEAYLRSAQCYEDNANLVQTRKDSVHVLADTDHDGLVSCLRSKQFLKKATYRQLSGYEHVIHTLVDHMVHLSEYNNASAMVAEIEKISALPSPEMVLDSLYIRFAHPLLRVWDEGSFKAELSINGAPTQGGKKQYEKKRAELSQADDDEDTWQGLQLWCGEHHPKLPPGHYLTAQLMFRKALSKLGRPVNSWLVFI